MRRLIGSSGSLESLLEYLEKHYFYSELELVKVNPKEYLLKNSKGIIEGVKVILKGNRARLEKIA